MLLPSKKIYIWRWTVQVYTIKCQLKMEGVHYKCLVFVVLATYIMFISILNLIFFNQIS